MTATAATNSPHTRQSRATTRSALDNLLLLMQRDRGYGDDAARRGMLMIFDLLGGEGELVSAYRAKLARALY